VTPPVTGCRGLIVKASCHRLADDAKAPVRQGALPRCSEDRLVDVPPKPSGLPAAPE
jgi:hypothetical protein